MHGMRVSQISSVQRCLCKDSRGKRESFQLRVIAALLIKRIIQECYYDITNEYFGIVVPLETSCYGCSDPLRESAGHV